MTDRELVTFGVFQVGMTSVDITTDGIQTAEYYGNENFYWGTSTLTIMFVPTITSATTEIMNNIIKYYRGRSDDVSWKDSVKKVGRHFTRF